MERIDVEPLVGALGVRFGMPKDAARAVLGTPHQSFRKGQDVDAWMGGSFHVFYSEDESTVEFIEVFASNDAHVQCYGADVFAEPAHTLIRRIETLTSLSGAVTEKGTLCIFHPLELAFWRPFASPRAEARFFQTISVGRPGY